jgi:protein TonB
MFKKTESFDDIVFENRNKAYGAYDLRKRYSRRGSVALAISLFILFSAVGAPLIAGMLNKNNDNTSFPNDGTFIMTEVDDKTDKFIPHHCPNRLHLQ